MTALEAIRWADERQHNGHSLESKLRWLCQVEGQVEQLHLRCGREWEKAEWSVETALKAEKPFDELYLHYLEAQIHYANQEYTKFNNAMALFSSLWQEYANFLRRGKKQNGQRTFF